MQHAPVVNTGTPAIPESTGRAYTALPPLDTPPPEKVAKPPDHGLPAQIRAPVNAEGPLESLQGEASQHAMQHTSQASVCALLIPPDSYTRSSIVLELDVEDLKAHVCTFQARRPVSDEGACARPVLWPWRVLFGRRF